MEKKIAKDLLSIGAVFLRPEQPFTWASGIKSPGRVSTMKSAEPALTASAMPISY